MAFLLRGYRNVSKRLPVTVAFATCFVKGGAADIFAQTVVEGREFSFRAEENSSIEKVNLVRSLAFATFSGGYTGSAQHYVYNVFMAQLFGKARSVTTALKMSLADVLVHAPFFYVPCYYAFEYSVLKGSAVEGMRALFIGDDESGPEFIPVMKNYAMIWPSVLFFNFAYAPRELRIAIVASVSFLWLIILSTISHHQIGDPAIADSQPFADSQHFPDPKPLRRESVKMN